MKKIKILLCFLLILSISGCGTKDTVNSDKLDGDDREDVTLVVYSGGAAASQIIDGWFADVISDELGLGIEIVTGQSDVERADVIITLGLEHSVTEYVETGIALEWTQELLSEYGQNITTYCKEHLDYFTELCGGKIYGVGRKENDTAPTPATFLITSYTEHPEEAMKFIDWLANPESMVIRENGPKELCWNIDEDGYYYLTDFGWECKNDSDTLMPGTSGLTFNDGSCPFPYDMWYGDCKNPMSQYGETFDGKDWIRSEE